MGKARTRKLKLTLRIKTIEPTIYFVNDNGLKNVVNVTIENTGSRKDTALSICTGTHQHCVPINAVPKGTSTHAVNFPDVREETTLQIALHAGGGIQHERKIEWRPQKHWHVFMEQRSHHDWGFTDLPSIVLENHANFMDTVLDFCDETDDYPEESKYRYTIEAAWSILPFLKTRDEAQIQRWAERMKQGRIELAALLGNQTTELCSHEELVRLLYPSFVLKHKYGFPVSTAHLNDIPGISWGLSSILAGAGVKYLSFGMPTWYFGGGEGKVHQLWDEEAVKPNGHPDAHWWEGPDGQKILMWHGHPGACPVGSEAENGFADAIQALDPRYPFDAIKVPMSGVYSDNAAPTLKYAYIAREWNERYAYPRLIVSNTRCFFEHIAKQLDPDTRTIRGEVPNTDYSVGATSTARETAINRLAHDELATAEKFAAIASCVAGYEYPAETIADAYENMLLFDEHTWGTSYPYGQAQDASLGEKGYLALRAAAFAQDVQIKSQNIIADQINLPKDGTHLVVFNALGHTRTDVVSMRLFAFRPCSQPPCWNKDQKNPKRPPDCMGGHAIGRNIIDPPRDIDDSNYDLVDLQTGKAIPFQIVELSSPRAPIPYAAHRWAKGQGQPLILKDIVFTANDVPAMGYKTYRLVPRKRRKAAAKSSIKVGARTIENRFFKIELDPKTGCIARIYDKQLKRQLVDPNARYQFNQLVLRGSLDSKSHVGKAPKIAKGKTGPVAGSLVASGSGPCCPQLTQEITLYDNVKRIDIANRILKDSTPLQEVYFAFPFLVENPQFQFEASGSVVRQFEDMVPGANTNTCTAQHYVDVSNEKGGVTWASRESHIASLGGFWPLYVSFPHHGVTPPNFGRPFPKQGDPIDGHIYSCVMNSNFNTNFNTAQTGDLLFRYSITAHPGDRVSGGSRDFGYDALTPLDTVCVNGKQKGALSHREGFAKVAPDNVMLLTIKRAEDGNGLIVRLIETDGVAAEAAIELPFFDIAEAFVTNPVEENQGFLRVSNNSVTVPVEAFGITTVRLTPR